MSDVFMFMIFLNNTCTSIYIADTHELKMTKMSISCAKSLVMICFDFLRCISSNLYFLDFKSTFIKAIEDRNNLSSSTIAGYIFFKLVYHMDSDFASH